MVVQIREYMHKEEFRRNKVFRSHVSEQVSLVRAAGEEKEAVVRRSACSVTRKQTMRLGPAFLLCVWYFCRVITRVSGSEELTSKLSMHELGATRSIVVYLDSGGRRGGLGGC